MHLARQADGGGLGKLGRVPGLQLVQAMAGGLPPVLGRLFAEAGLRATDLQRLAAAGDDVVVVADQRDLDAGGADVDAERDHDLGVTAGCP